MSLGFMADWLEYTILILMASLRLGSSALLTEFIISTLPVPVKH